MKLNLADFVTVVEETFEEVELEFGNERTVKTRVYQVPMPALWTIKPDIPYPERPTVEMKTATGRTQERPAKEGDPGYAEYIRDLTRYKQAESALMQDFQLVLALRDIDYPDLSTPPAYLGALVNGDYPAHPIRRKAFWLKATLLASLSNYNKVSEAMLRQAAGVTPEDVAEVKKNSASTTTAAPSTDPETAEAEAELTS